MRFCLGLLFVLPREIKISRYLLHRVRLTRRAEIVGAGDGGKVGSGKSYKGSVYFAAVTSTLLTHLIYKRK